MEDKKYKVIIGGKLIDGLGGIPIDESVIVIEGSNIVDVGLRGQVELPDEKDADFFEVNGKTIIPGLIDTHTHIQLSKGEMEFDFLRQSVPLKTVKAASNAQKALEAGFTTIRDLGAENLIDIGVRDAINEKIIEGPRMLVSGYKIMPTGADFQVYPPEVSIGGRFTMDTPDEARKAVRKLLALGVDVVKIMTSGRTFRKSSSPNAYALTLEEAEIVVSEAHNQGVKVSAHVHGAKGVKIALEAGCDTLEHGTVLDDYDVEFMSKNNVFLIPTFSYGKHVEILKESTGLPGYIIDKALASRSSRLKSFQKAFKAGVPIAMGTDAGMPFTFHGENAFEIEQLVEAGMTPMEALVASTYTGSKALGISDSVGTISKGKMADLVIVDGNPLKDIRILQHKDRILGVFKEGEIVVDRGIRDY